MMLAALASFTLIFTPNNGGPITVVEGLSQYSCEEALSFAEFGRTRDERERAMEAHFAQERRDRAARGEKEDPNSNSTNYAEAMLGVGRCIPFRVNSDASSNSTATATGGTATNDVSGPNQMTNSTAKGGTTLPNVDTNNVSKRRSAKDAPPVTVNQIDPMTYGFGISTGVFSPLFPAKVFRYGDKK